jgi:Pyruvate/2-oxoacid:ferredoxin oxidoreductase gamma subunit
MEAGGIVLYNGSEIPVDCVRRDVRMVALPFTELADELGAAKVGNIVMLGALLEATGMLDQDRVVGALKRLVHPRFFDLDVAALARGRQEFRESASDDYLWGV